jgi:hypothetical protein
VELELRNPYDDLLQDDWLEQMAAFNIIQDYMCCFEELLGGNLGGETIVWDV